MIRYALLGLCAITVMACTGTVEEKDTKRRLALAIAMDRIEAFNAMGIDPVQLDYRQLVILDTACIVATLGAIEYGLDESVVLAISSTCAVIQAAAAEARTTAALEV